MNYIELINQFWAVRELVALTSVDAGLYFALLHKCNRIGWTNPFPFSNRQIGALLNMSEKTLIASRNRLKQSGLIDFVSGKTDRTATLYTLNYCKNSSSSVSSSDSSSVSSSFSSSGENTPDIIKHKTKLKQKENPQTPSDGLPPKPKPDFIDKLTDCFAQKFKQSRGIDYEITNRGKERAAAAKLLGIFRKKYPDAPAEEAFECLSNYFGLCLKISDKWLAENMCLPIILNQFNKINSILKNGTQRTKNGAGATSPELAVLFAKHFASDYPRQ